MKIPDFKYENIEYEVLLNDLLKLKKYKKDTKLYNKELTINAFKLLQIGYDLDAYDSSFVNSTFPREIYNPIYNSFRANNFDLEKKQYDFLKENMQIFLKLKIHENKRELENYKFPDKDIKHYLKKTFSKEYKNWLIDENFFSEIRFNQINKKKVELENLIHDYTNLNFKEELDRNKTIIADIFLRKY